MKLDRQNVIMEIIAQQDIETQNQLLEALAARGVKSTQATLSRDIRDMRLIKELGPNGNYRYVMAASQDNTDMDARLKKIFKECVLSYDLAQNILVIKTQTKLKIRGSLFKYAQKIQIGYIGNSERI